MTDGKVVTANNIEIVAEIAGMKVVLDPTTPDDRVLFRNDSGECVGAIINIGHVD